ncbi:nicotinate-nucleotide--dimethylbenzimidazole phosphoribosyltransferase [Streptomyces sp. Amel2xC10]|uniref:nicotinate-nucleotide--dimethylbenzimidazole phosphoribosyltransferase n=1 Tax=Streptomyces sp. Amel2xC10 TaxID=1305826 RepID=UPI000A086765|nr:nicotinate-nucleotide--dimethylbenzimidazole phosphoribosyltransferase [Streptomyces sp. Amel2xC10]SMF24302.1 nicotinate-nucleotide-dimethylbenzimidazole phosphoribosyltransferase /cob(II)yrinic acid a,c-diamide reductase [Streptomyces sp. Amel2xC10]
MTDTGQIPGEGSPENAGMVEQPGASGHGAYTYLSETTAEDEDLLLLPGAQSAWGNEVAPPAPEPVVETVHTPGPLDAGAPDAGTVPDAGAPDAAAAAAAAASHEPGPHETAGRDSGSVDLSGVRLPGPATPPPAPRRPLHLGPPIPDASASPVRSLADRGPAGAPVRHPGAAAPGPEYLDIPQLRETPAQGAAPWPAPGAAQAAAHTTAHPAAHPAAPAAAAQVVAPARETAETATETAAPAETSAAAAAAAVPAAAPVAEPVGAAEAVVARVATEAQAAVPAQAAPVTLDVGEVLGAAMLAEQAVVAEAAEVAVTQDAVVQQAVEVPQAEAQPEPEPEPEPVVVSAPAPVESVQVPDAPVPAPEGAPVAEVPEAVVPVQETPAPVIPAPAEEAPAPVAAPEAPVAETAAEPAPTLAAEVFPTAPAEPVVVVPAEPVLTVPAAPEPQEQQAPEPVAVPLVDPAPQAPEAAVAPEQAEPESQQAAVIPEQAAAEPVAGPQVAEAQVAEPEIAEPRAAEAPTAEAPVAEPVVARQQEAQPQEATATAPEEAPAPASAAPAASEPAPEPAPAPAPQAAVVEPTPQPAAAAEATEAPAPASAPVPEQLAAPQGPPPEQFLGQFVPVEGTVPTTPHLAPTPPHPLVLPPDALQPPAPADEAPKEQPPAEAETPAPDTVVPSPQGAPATPAPAVTVPAPRAADPAPVPVTPVAEPGNVADPEVAQNPEDLETRAADQEESQEESRAAMEEAREPAGPAAPAYDDAEREAVLKVMRERRDIRNGFRGDPIPHEVLLRVLEAAHTAPSVGHSQPWDFVVIRSAETRNAMHELAMRQRDAYAKSLPKGRAKQFKELKIEAILETPVNIVVTADPTRGGRHTLGRHTQPQMAPYSAALAVENLWLAARAEGLGVGWVSFFDEREMVRALGLPEHLEVIAYLCVGYVDEFPAEPELMQAGWAKRRPLSWVVHEETYGRRALPGEDPHDLLAETVAGIRPLDAKALGEAWERQKRMTKPAGALGMLEIISAQLSGLSRQCPPPIPEPAAVAIFAGDHGVHAQGVTPWPQEVTAQMVANFLGGGAVCNAFATQVGAEVCIVDVGVAADLPATPGLLPRKVRAGTSDMTIGPAMTREEAKQAIEVGIETARDLVAAGNKALLTGEMGIANTTASAALISVFTGADPAEVTGRGTGINDETLARKTEVVRRALELHQPDPADPLGVLAAIGGFEHAAMVGLLLGGASLRTPVILDGVSAGAAALVARAIAPEVLAACIAGHRSAEPGHVAALNKLGLRPLVDLDLRLGEGTGALLALPLVQSTARAMHEVATFDSAGVTEK